MIHFNTQNNSFLKMYFILKELGIKNNTFFLELIDSSLESVNPHDPLLSEELQMRIHHEVIINPWYFFREVIRIPEVGEKKFFELHRGNLAMLYLIFHSINIAVLLPRQCFKTTTTIIFYLWCFYFGTRDNNILFFAHNNDLVIKNIRSFKNIREALPPYLQLQHARKDRDNIEQIMFTPLKNIIKKQAPSLSKEGADRLGRGFSTPMQHYDEPVTTPNIGITYGGAVFAYASTAMNAEKYGKLHGKIMTTTAGYLNEESGLWTKNFYANAADYHERLLDMTLDELKLYVKHNSNNDFVNIEFMYFDLGKDDNYFERMCREVNHDEDRINREILNRWIDVTKDHPLGQSRLMRLAGEKRAPVDSILINKVYFLNLYIPIENLDTNLKYVAGLDCGGNLKKDYSALTVVNPYNAEVMAVMRTNSHSTAMFSQAIAQIMMLFPKMILIPERNSMGIVIIDNIIDADFSIQSRVYHDEKNVPGVFTDKNIRNLLFGDVIRSVVDDYGNKIKDRHIIGEIETLERSRTGRIDHKKDAHDDTLISFLFVFWFLMHSKQREKYIDPAKIFHQVRSQHERKKEKHMIRGNINDIIARRMDKKHTGNSALSERLDQMYETFQNSQNINKKPGSIEYVRREDRYVDPGEMDSLEDVERVRDQKETDVFRPKANTMDTPFNENAQPDSEMIEMKKLIFGR